MADIKWKIRVKRHKCYKKITGFIVKLIALRLIKLGGYELNITNNKDGIDHYGYCKHWEKEFCTRRKYWQAYLKNGGYRVLGTTENELYLEIINLLLFNEVRFPFCKK